MLRHAMNRLLPLALSFLMVLSNFSLIVASEHADSESYYIVDEIVSEKEMPMETPMEVPENLELSECQNTPIESLDIAHTLVEDYITIEELTQSNDIISTLDSNASVVHEGTVGVGGAPWRIYDDRTLVVSEGFIHWVAPSSNSPWSSFESDFDKIVFTGPITAGTSLRGLFANLQHVTSIEGLSFFDTSNVTDMSILFVNARRLLTLEGLDAWDTSRVTAMYHMFQGTFYLRDLRSISDWDTGNVTDMNNMFWRSGVWNIDLPTFYHHGLDVSSWDTGNVRNMQQMFADTYLWHLDLSGWNTSNVTDMSFMFAQGLLASPGALQGFRGILDISTWDTSNVTNMHRMFLGQNRLTTLDLTGWDTRRANMSAMFQGMSALNQIALGENFRFNSTALPNVPVTSQHTGRWINVGSGTIDYPESTYEFTSAELSAFYLTPGFADTWIWQRVGQPVASRITASTTAPNFGSLLYGYTLIPEQTIIITNPGTQSVTLNPLPSVENWTLTPSGNWTTAMDQHDTRSFTIRPSDGLGVGTHNPTIVITGSRGASVQIRPSFTVTPTSSVIDYVGILEEAVNKLPNTNVSLTVSDGLVKGIPSRLTNDTFANLSDVAAVNSATTFIGTGTEIVFVSGTILTAVVFGDVTGTGTVDLSDVNRVLSHFRGRLALESVYLIAADINQDGNINLSVVNRILSYFRGRISSL